MCLLQSLTSKSYHRLFVGVPLLYFCCYRLQAKYEAEIFHNLPKEHAAKAVPNGLAREFHNSHDGEVVAGLVRDVLQALGMDSTLRVFEPESSTEPLARANLKVGLRLYCSLTRKNITTVFSTTCAGAGARPPSPHFNT